MPFKFKVYVGRTLLAERAFVLTAATETEARKIARRLFSRTPRERRTKYRFVLETQTRSRFDRRTREGIENTVLEKVRADGGFSVFWAIANSGRANAIQRLSDAGKIKRIRRGLYPWCAYRIEQCRKVETDANTNDDQ